MLNKKALSATAGAADKLYVEDVFSTYLYTGTGSSLTINNGIDLSNEGGMFWTKARTSATFPNHMVYDTERGVTVSLSTNTTDANDTNSISSFNNNGYSLTGGLRTNQSSQNYVSWTFRKAEKFFDVVTYTGNGTAGRTVSHNLGSVPGFIIVKRTNNTGSWACYHRNIGNTAAIQLNYANTPDTFIGYWNNTSPTSTNFTLGSFAEVNGNGDTFVAYLFAHDAGGFGDSGSESVIKCGSYTGNGSASGQAIDLGWEPQWLMIKGSSTPSNWQIVDVMRGATVAAGGTQALRADLSNAEYQGDLAYPHATGFVAGPSTNTNNSGTSYIYIAIRRGPMKTPEAGTEVFSPNVQNASSTTAITTGFPVDLIIGAQRSKAIFNSTVVFDRLRGTRGVAGGGKWLATDANNSENSDYGQNIDRMDGFLDLFFNTAQSVSSSTVYWSFKRAPGFFDIATYNGTGVTKTVNHNLGVAPELIIIKDRNTGFNGAVYSSALGNTKKLNLFSSSGNSAEITDSTFWNNTSPTSSVFTVGTANDINYNTATFVAYLFGTVPGVSKVGSYTGTGTTQQINCGFTSSARFVLIKRTDSSGNWYVWDSARGIIAGNDPFLFLDSTIAETTIRDYIDTYSSGFEISSTAPAGMNANGGTFIYLAIA